MAGAAFKRGKSKQDYATPPALIRAVERYIGKIGFDLAASQDNAKAPRFFSEEQDALAQDWTKVEVPPRRPWLWLNPPFARIKPWAKKCAEEAKRGAKILLLVPAAVGSDWWRDHVDGRAVVLFLNGRIPFDPRNPKWGYPKDCALCVYGAEEPPGYEIWSWRRDV